MATYADAIVAAVIGKIEAIATGSGQSTTVRRVVRGAPRSTGDRPPNGTPPLVYVWIEGHRNERGPASHLWTSTITIGFTAHAQGAGSAGSMEDAAFQLYSDIVAVLQADPSIGLSYVHDVEAIEATENGAAPLDPDQHPIPWVAGTIRIRYVVERGA